MGQIELNFIAWNRTVWHWNCILMLNWIVWINWIVWNRNVFDNQTVLMQNWIVWNRTVYLYKSGFGIK